MMNNDTVNVLNTLTGQTGKIRRVLFENPRINSGILVEVKQDTKPFVKELYSPKTPEEFEEAHADKLGDSEESKPRKSRKEKDND